MQITREIKPKPMFRKDIPSLEGGLEPIEFYDYHKEIKDYNKKQFSKADLVDYSSYLLHEVFDKRTRLERNMTPFIDYITEWLRQKTQNK